MIDETFLPRAATCDVCVDCIYRQVYTSEITGKETGYRRMVCGVFTTKPNDVAFEGAECPEYEQELV